VHHFATALSAVIIATVLVGGTSPTPAEAATTSSATQLLTYFRLAGHLILFSLASALHAAVASFRAALSATSS
jgi:hypothetical protein